MEAITNNNTMLVATPARICPGFGSGCCNYQRAPGGSGTPTHRPGCPLGCRVTKGGTWVGFALTLLAAPIFWGLHTCNAPQGSREGWGTMKALLNCRGRCAGVRTGR